MSALLGCYAVALRGKLLSLYPLPSSCFPLVFVLPFLILGAKRKGGISWWTFIGLVGGLTVVMTAVFALSWPAPPVEGARPPWWSDLAGYAVLLGFVGNLALFVEGIGSMLAEKFWKGNTASGSVLNEHAVEDRAGRG
ncbi:MAG TPA: hypothetical protein PLH94_13140 [Fimbriimonadaceae bacterium]|nr:hypothetical protein [Fimbriimonadaceae bacterium]